MSGAVPLSQSLAALMCCEDACRFVADLGPEWRQRVHHLLFCSGCWIHVTERVELSPDQWSQRIEGILAAEGLMAALLSSAPGERTAMLETDRGFQTGAFCHLVSCGAGGGASHPRVPPVAVWACTELNRIRLDRHHPLNRAIPHGFVLDVLRLWPAVLRRSAGLTAARKALPAQDPRARHLLRMESEAQLWSQQIQTLSLQLAFSLLPPQPWYHPCRESPGPGEASGPESGIALARFATAPQEWMPLLCHVMGCPACRIRLGFAAQPPSRVSRPEPTTEPGPERARAASEAVLEDLGLLAVALREGIDVCVDHRQKRALLWALEDLALVTKGTATPISAGTGVPRLPLSPKDLGPELQKLGEHVVDCPVCREEAQRSAPSSLSDAEELYATLLAHPWSWEKIVAIDGRAWTAAFGQVLACELTRSPISCSRKEWLKDIQRRRLEALLAEGPGWTGATPHPLLSVQQHLEDVKSLRSQLCALAYRLPRISVELYESHRDLVRVERRLEWLVNFLLERAGPASARPPAIAQVESHVGQVSRASAAQRQQLAQLASSDRVAGWGLPGRPDKPPAPVEWVELVDGSSRLLRVLHDISVALGRSPATERDPWQAELMLYLHRELEEVDRRVADTLLALAREGVAGPRSRRPPRG